MNFAHTLTTPASSCRPQPAAEPAHYYINFKSLLKLLTQKASNGKFLNLTEFHIFFFRNYLLEAY